MPTRRWLLSQWDKQDQKSSPLCPQHWWHRTYRITRIRARGSLCWGRGRGRHRWRWPRSPHRTGSTPFAVVRHAGSVCPSHWSYVQQSASNGMEQKYRVSTSRLPWDGHRILFAQTQKKSSPFAWRYRLCWRSTACDKHVVRSGRNVSWGNMRAWMELNCCRARKVENSYLTTEYAGLSCRGFGYVCRSATVTNRWASPRQKWKITIGEQLV